MSAAEHSRVLAFSQLTWRESLRDLEVRVGANPSELYGMRFRSLIKKSTVADANERRYWRIWTDLAAVLIRRALAIYIEDDQGLDLKNTIYALDSSTIYAHIRRVRFADSNSKKALIFLTNNTDPPAATVAALYENRLQVELFFKRIMQHLRIKHSLRRSESAVKTPIWVAV